MVKPMIIAHRGASRFAPENTLPAFELALSMGAEAIETDVHLTKDQVPVLIHDEKVNRTTNGKGYIKDFTFKELQNLDAGSWFAKDFRGTNILSLDAFLQWAQDKPLRLNIELKNNKIDYPHLEEIVYEYTAHHKLLDRTIFSTFNPDSIKRLEPYKGQVEIAYLTSRGKSLIQRAKELKVDALHIKYTLLTPGLAHACRHSGFVVRIYTVNSQKQLNQCFREACDGVITDMPNLALEYREAFYSRQP